MAKQTFTTGSVLTATQMNNLNQNDYNWSVDGKVASYVLVAADAGKRIEMNSGSATTITVNTGLFTAGDMVYLSNIGSGVCTVTAGTATVNKATNASLALGQYQSGMLYFVSASAAIFYPFDIGSSGGVTKSYSLLNTGGTALTGAATVTVSGVTGDDLLILVRDASSVNAASTIGVRFNGITTNSYALIGPAIATAATYSSNMLVGNNFLPDTFNNVALGQMGTNAAASVNGYCRVFGAKSTTLKPYLAGGTGDGGGGNTQGMYITGGVFTSSSAITSVSIFSSTGNLDNGTVYVYEAQ